MGPLDPHAVLKRYPAIHQPIGPLVALGGGGGLSGSLLWRFESGNRPLLVRAWPDPGPSIDQVERTHRWLREAATLGFVPAPVETLDGRTISAMGGRFWELVPWIEGEAAAGSSPVRTEVDQAFRALAAFHNRLGAQPSLGPSPGLLARLREVDELRGGGLARFRSSARALLDEDLRCLAFQWIEEAFQSLALVRSQLLIGAAMTARRQPCLRDVRPDHFLFREGRLVGLIDFGAMAEDSVVGDLARLSTEWFGGPDDFRREAWDAYGSLRPLDAEELRMLPIFELSTACLIGAHWLKWHCLEGRSFDGDQAVRNGLEKGLRLLRAAVGRSRGVIG